MKNRSNIRIFALLIALVLLASMMTAALAESTATAQPESVPLEQPKLGVTSVQTIEQDGYQFKDLNKNGKLDPYEDWRLSAEERAADLLSQMTSEDKAAQMLHITLVTLKESWFNELDIGFALAYTYLSEGAETAAKKHQRNPGVGGNLPSGHPGGVFDGFGHRRKLGGWRDSAAR